MAKSQIITIRLNAGTADFITKMNEAGAKVGEFGQRGNSSFKTFEHGAVSSMQASSAAIRELENPLGNNIRAVERFLSTTLKLGPVLQAAFPIVGALAFGGVLVEMGTKAYQFFKDMAEAPLKIAGAFRELNAPLKTTNDELQVANDRLANDIAKLEGHRQNTLKLALDEARVAADKLADSLDKDLKSLNKLLSEQNTGFFKSLLTGNASTSDLTKEFGGDTGFLGFPAKIADITSKGEEALAKATTAKQRDAAQTQLNSNLTKAYGDELAKVNKLIADSEALQAKRGAQSSARGGLGSGFSDVRAPEPDDQTNRLALLRGVRSNLQSQQNGISLRADNTTLTAKKEALTANNDNEALDRPYENKLKSLNAQLVDVTAKLSAVGQDANAEVLAKAFGTAAKSIEEVNKALERHHTALTLDQQLTILASEEDIARAESETAYKSKLDATNEARRQSIYSTQILTQAIGAGYEATKQANVEAQLLAQFGKEYQNPSRQNDVGSARTALGNQFDANNLKQIDTTVDALNDQIEVENQLAAAQANGAEAVRLVTLAARIRDIVTKGGTEATREQVKAETDLFNAQKANLDAAQLAELNLKIEATKRLTEAQLGGAEAVRQANLENKIADLQSKGASPAVIAATRTEDALNHQQEVTAEALKSGLEYKNQLESINQQIDALNKIKASGKDNLAVEQSLFNLEQERLQVMVQQQLSLRTASAGVKAFFLEMQEAGKSTANIIYDALNSTVDKLSDSFAKLASGQKASFSKAFQEIANGILQDSTKNLLRGAAAQLGSLIYKNPAGGQAGGAGGSAAQGTLAKLGGLIGIKPPGQRQDGQTQPTAIWVQMAPTPGSAAPGALPSILGGGNINPGLKIPGLGGKIGNLGGDKGGGLFSGGQGGGIFNLTDGGGADVLADSIRSMGLNGGSTRAASKRSSSAGGGGYTDNRVYNIDARGSQDPALTVDRVRQAIVASHDDAISSAIQLQVEKLLRTPQ